MLESEVRCRLNTRVMWTLHINNKLITQCPVYQKRVENINSNKEQQTLVKPVETLVLAPIPATNPWNKDKTENRELRLHTELKKLNELIDIKKIKMTVAEDSNFAIFIWI
jgi:hypothetical protein